MEEHKTERGPRGRYARLICLGCRSRKIKCILPDPNGIGPLGIPQPKDKACKRCRAFDLDCVLDETILGRPAAKRKRVQQEPPAVSFVSKISPGTRDSGSGRSPLLDSQGYMFSDSVGGQSVCEGHLNITYTAPPTPQEVFQSMVEPRTFLSSVLAHDDAFASEVGPSNSTWDTTLSNLVGNSLAASLDACLVWHRFFIPNLPTLVSIRHRLTSDVQARENSATNLLFSLLSLMALEITDLHLRKYPMLAESIESAVSHYGEDFFFAPPTHRDSILACTVLLEFRPTALATSQGLARRILDSNLHVDIAYRVAERLQLIPTDRLPIPNIGEWLSSDFEHSLQDSLQSLQVQCYDALLGGFVTKSITVMQRKLSWIAPYIDIYQSLLQGNQPISPVYVYQMQYYTAVCMQMRGMIKVKQTWDDLPALARTIEEMSSETERQALLSEHLLTSAYSAGKEDEVKAARDLIQLHYRMVYVSLCGMGILYAGVLKTRSDRDRQDRDLVYHEAVQFREKVVNSLKHEKEEAITKFLLHIAAPYPGYQQAMVEKFVEISGTLKLHGVSFYPPLRQLIVDVAWHCKSLVENNIIQLKTFGRPNPNFNAQRELFEQCAKRLEAVTASKRRSADEAFTTGCLYSGAGKLVHGLRDLMDSLESNVLDKQAQPPQEEATAGVALPLSLDLDTTIGLECPSDGLDLWPHMGGFSYLDALPEQFDWGSALNLFHELEGTEDLYTWEQTL